MTGGVSRGFLGDPPSDGSEQALRPSLFQRNFTTETRRGFEGALDSKPSKIGDIGTLGIQILKSYGVKVTGVDSDEKLDLMTSLGFDSVMDYRKTDFTDTGEKYDLILDTKSYKSVFKYARSLKKNGTYITVGGSMVRLLEIALFGLLLSLFTGKKLSVFIHKSNKGLD